MSTLDGAGPTPAAARAADVEDPAARSVEAQLLHLLAHQAPAEELRRVGNRAGGVAAEAVAAALGVRALLSDQRRREQQLAALYETAGDLSSTRELEPVLRAIVRRARELLGSDVAYLMLNDDEQHLTYMRVTEGIVTDSFKSVRLDLGSGLGGLVAATCTPYATADYPHDHRLVHTIDDVVRGEGLIAIVGVPLRVGQRVIGVLFAADRRVREFGRDEVALLASLADHAAIALENASLFGELREALGQLSSAHEAVRAHSETLERAVAVHERLAAVLLDGGGLTDVACAVVEVLGGGLLVVDPAGRLLISVGDVGADVVPALLTALPERLGARGVTLEPVDGTGAVAVGALAGRETLATLVLVATDVGDAQLRILERAAVVTALLLLQEQSVLDAELRVRGELFDELFADPQRDVAGLQRRVTTMGLDLHRRQLVAVARGVDPAHAPALLRAAAALPGTGGLSGSHLGEVVLVVPAGVDDEPGSGSDVTSLAAEVRAGPAPLAEWLSVVLAQAVGGPVTVGAAGPVRGVGELGAARRDARRCADMLRVLGREGDGAGIEDLGVYGLLLASAGPEELHRFIRRTVGPVLDWDAQRGSELAPTLLTFFAEGGNFTRTAATLFVHVNTLYQRLDRVSALLGPAWRTGDAALQVHLALTLRSALGEAD